MAYYLLFEDATGYALFEIVEAEGIGGDAPGAQTSVLDPKQFSKMVKMKAFVPFASAEEALGNINDLTEGKLRIAGRTRMVAVRCAVSVSCCRHP